MKLKSIAFLLYSMALTTNVNAQLSFTSIQEVWSYADANNIQIKTLRGGVSIAEKNVRQAYGSMLPTASINGGFTDNVKIQSTLVPADLFNPAVPAGTYTEATFGRRYIYNASVTAQFDLLNFRDWFNIQTEKLNTEIAKLNIAKSRADLYEQLANGFFSYILLNEAQIISKENLKTATALYENAVEKFNEGLLNEVSVNTALINKEKAAQSLDITTNNKWLQYNNIRSLLNTGDSIIITNKIPSGIAHPIDSDFAPAPAVALSYKQMLASKIQWRSSKAAFIPTLSAIYQFNTQVATDQLTDFDNGNTTPQQYWGLRLAVPIFSGNVRRYQVQKSKIDFDLKQLQYESAKVQSAIYDQNIWQSYNAAKKAFESSQIILKLYEDNDAHADRRWKNGIISIDERLHVYSELINNQSEYLQSMSNFFIQQYRINIRQTTFSE